MVAAGMLAFMSRSTAAWTVLPGLRRWCGSAGMVGARRGLLTNTVGFPHAIAFEENQFLDVFNLQQHMSTHQTLRQNAQQVSAQSLPWGGRLSFVQAELSAVEQRGTGMDPICVPSRAQSARKLGLGKKSEHV